MLSLENAKIRQLSKDDLEMVLQWRNHIDIRQWMVNSKPISFQEHSAWFKRNQDRSDRFFFIFEYQQRPCGYVSFVAVPNSFVYEWGFYIEPNAQQGLGSLLARVALDHAFFKIKADKVFGQVIDFNERSIKFHQKMGFCKEGVLRKHFQDERGVFDIHQFGLLKKEWVLKNE